MENSYSINASYLPLSLDISGANTVEFPFARAFKLLQARIFVSVVTATAAETLTFRRRPVIGVTTPTPIDIGTYAIAADVAIGTEYRLSFAAVADTDFNSGESLAVTCGNSTGTGTVYVGILGFHYDAGPNPQQSFSTVTSKPISGGSGSIVYAAVTAT
jgi:hypothetical protein